MWTLTGLVMVARPIEEVRGDHLRAPSVPISPDGLVLPRPTAAVDAVELVSQPRGAAWIVTEADGGRYRYSGRNGSVIAPGTRAEARRIVESAWAGETAIASITHIPVDSAPLDLRRNTASWEIRSPTAPTSTSKIRLGRSSQCGPRGGASTTSCGACVSGRAILRKSWL